jgi:hypothetical protein
MKLFILVLAAALSGCTSLFGGRDDIGGRDLEQNTSDIDSRIQETRTLAGLKKLEDAVGDYYKTENKIPQKLTALIPKYLAEVPSVELGIGGHRDSNLVMYYPNIIRDGVVDGSQLKDSGRWGYTYNDQQVIVFVDCTHTTSQGKPWFHEPSK